MFVITIDIFFSMLLGGLCLVSLTLFRNALKKNTSSIAKPPGPEGFISTIIAIKYFTFFKTDLLELVLSLYNRWVNKRTLNPVGFKVGPQQFYLITDPRQINKIFRDDRNFIKVKKFIRAFSQVLGYNLVSISDGKDWKQMRDRTKNYLNSVFLARYNEITMDVVDKLTIPKMMEMAKSGEDLDVWDEMMKVASAVAFTGFLGDDIDSIPPKLYNSLNEIFGFIRQKGVSPFYLPLWVPTKDNLQLHRNQKMLKDMLLPRIETDKEKPTVFGDTIRAHTSAIDGSVDVTKCLQEIISNLIGSSETTIILMTWACYFVAQDLKLQDRLYKEITDHLQGRSLKECDLSRVQLLDNLLHETLRLKSPSYILARQTTNDVNFDGYHLKKDSIVLMCQYISHRLPAFWKNPHKFDPDRYNNNKTEKLRNLFSFGGGKYLCIGNKFAFQEARIMFAKVLLNFKMYPGTGLEKVGESYKVTMRPDRPVLIKFIPRGH